MYLNVARRSGDGHSALLVHWSSLVKFLPLQAAAQTPTMPSPKAEAGGAASGESSANPSPEKVKAAGTDEGAAMMMAQSFHGADEDSMDPSLLAAVGLGVAHR